ncbi:hypothetical protein QQS21_004844 [Conoideocrella luteorostrata]|uniref:TauD/TfdA-like domain-containing protein n=1 Tax=Conoideocrella luteorostrata TaxID=1105319 RepID=A0AAJ0CRL6_9HYPO|nr:hypothetical protein QQS21_004844 [Conoideocrella luteorostrata]
MSTSAIIKHLPTTLEDRYANIDITLNEIHHHGSHSSINIGEPIKWKSPKTLSGPTIWSGADFEHNDSFTLYLSAEDIEEVEHALQVFKTLEVDVDGIAKSNFVLPSLSKKLEEIVESIHNGQGFFVIRGLDMSRYTVEDGIILYLGIATYIGDKRGLQDRKGNVLAHITSSKAWDVPMNQRHGIHSTMALPFHSDMGCDILALQVRHSALDGGSTFLSSASTIFNRLSEDEPEVVETLLEPSWPVQYSGKEARYYLAPAMTVHQGRLMASMDPKRFGPHPASSGTTIPALSKRQEYALDRVGQVARATDLRLNLKRGDLLFFNNWAVLHRREAYDDHGEASSRHLVRMWLRNTEHGWSVPPSMKLPWQSAYGDGAKHQTRVYAMEPEPKYSVPKYSAGSAAFLLEDSDDDSDN